MEKEKKQPQWHVVIDGSGCPKNNDRVIALWDTGTEREASIAQYDPETKEWFSLNAGSRGDALIAPDYWIEYPYD